MKNYGVSVFSQGHNDCTKFHENLPPNSKVETERRAAGVMSLSNYNFCFRSRQQHRLKSDYFVMNDRRLIVMEKKI